MPRIPPADFQDGDALEPWHINFIMGFIRRWMKLSVAPPLQLDDTGESPPLLWLGDIDDMVPILTPSGGITAGSYADPTFGTATLLIEDAGGPAFTSANTAVVYNCYDTDIPGDVFGWARYRGPFLYFVVGDC